MPRFRALGHEVGVVVFNGERTVLMERLERECPECRIYRLGKSVYSPLHIIRLARIMRQYDMVHTHNSSPQLFAAIANVFCHKKLVTTEHNTNNRKREKGGLFRLVDKWMYGRYDQIICISEVAENMLRMYLNDNDNENENENGDENLNENGDENLNENENENLNGNGNENLNGNGNENENDNENDNENEDEARRKGYQLSIKRSYNICTINNGVDVEAIHGAEPIAEMKSGKFVVVMVAGFREAKDQDTVIRAIALLPKDDYELWLVGDGTRRANLELIIDNLQLGDHVKLLGLRTDVPNVLKTADVVVMSSHWEGLSLSNIEGMSAGKPFVASDVNGLREVTQGYGLLFPHEDADALANIIQRLHDDCQYYQEIAARCYERAKEFDISKMASAYNEVYLQLTIDN